MYVYIGGIIILIAFILFIFLLKGKETTNKFFFLVLFTAAYIVFCFDFNNLYIEIPKPGIVKIYLNVLYFCLLAFFMLLMDQKWKAIDCEEHNIEKLIKITKIFTYINAIITVYFIYTLSTSSSIPIPQLYLKHPYFLELNFVSNAILGNILKSGFFNIILIVLIKVKTGKYKNFVFYFLFSLLILLAPNQKGGLILTILAITHIIIYYKNINFLKLIRLLLIMTGGVVLVFYVTYSYYKTAGVDLNIMDKFYTYLTFPIAGTAFHSKVEISSIFELKTFSGFFNKLNLLELYNIDIHRNENFINGVPIGNVGGVFAPLIEDFGFIGPIVFIVILVFFINFLQIFRKSFLFDTLFIIMISFLDMTLFGNYFTNPLFFEVIFAFVLFFIFNKIKLPSIKFKWKV